MPTRKTTTASPRKSAAARKSKPATPTKATSKKVMSDAPAKKPSKQRVRLVRDSFTMPEPDFALIAALKARALAAKRETKKSELLRAGLQVLMALDDATLMNALGRLQPLKLGRPKKGH